MLLSSLLYALCITHYAGLPRWMLCALRTAPDTRRTPGALPLPACFGQFGPEDSEFGFQFIAKGTETLDFAGLKQAELQADS